MGSVEGLYIVQCVYHQELIPTFFKGVLFNVHEHINVGRVMYSAILKCDGYVSFL